MKLRGVKTNCGVLYIYLRNQLQSFLTICLCSTFSNMSFTAPDLLGLENVKPQDVLRIKDFTKSSNTVKSDAVLVVRVLCKSRILHYAKVGKNDKWPFQV